MQWNVVQISAQYDKFCLITRKNEKKRHSISYILELRFFGVAMVITYKQF